MDKKISIILSTYNEAPVIEQTINEIFNNGVDVDKLPKNLDDKVKTETERQKKLGEYRDEHGLTKTSIAEKVYEKLGVKCNRKLVHSVLENKSQEMIRKKLDKIDNLP